MRHLPEDGPPADRRRATRRRTWSRGSASSASPGRTA
jgi:hypothetical protein